METTEPKSREVIARKFALGQILDIELQDTGKVRFQSPLLGMREGKYLVTDLPSITRHGSLRDRLLDEQELIVRTICERTTGECLGFKSHIYARLKSPDALLFISYPPAVQVHELRSETRLLVYQRATLMLDELGQAISGLLTDLSASGCRFEVEEAERWQVKREERVNIEFVHPENGGLITKSGMVRSVRNQNNFLSVGMAFDK
jgi:c-di-GMP-binding flagellar brake protein YcgR